jgi:hypothetical protein
VSAGASWLPPSPCAGGAGLASARGLAGGSSEANITPISQKRPQTVQFQNSGLRFMNRKSVARSGSPARGSAVAAKSGGAVSAANAEPDLNETTNLAALEEYVRIEQALLKEADGKMQAATYDDQEEWDKPKGSGSDRSSSPGSARYGFDSKKAVTGDQPSKLVQNYFATSAAKSTAKIGAPAAAQGKHVCML